MTTRKTNSIKLPRKGWGSRGGKHPFPAPKEEPLPHHCEICSVEITDKNFGRKTHDTIRWFYYCAICA